VKRSDTAQVCALLKASFPAWSATSETIEMWHMMLKDLNSEIVMRATQDWILTDERFPTIAGIRKKCAEIYGVLPMTATEAWAEVHGAITLYGYHGGKPDWSSETITQTVRAIGWWQICQSDNPSTIRAQFIKMYNELAEPTRSEIVRSVGFQLGSGAVELPMVKSKTPSLSYESAF
jgi:Loader and inhibitor of phage G40P